VKIRTASLTAPAAFDLFTRRMAMSWPFKGHACVGDQAVDVHFEPRAGGAVTDIACDGARMAWGTLPDWSPPDGFAMCWFAGLDAQAAAKRDQHGGGWPAMITACRTAAEHATGGST
jgi:hypothetical protein